MSLSRISTTFKDVIFSLTNELQNEFMIKHLRHSSESIKRKRCTLNILVDKSVPKGTHDEIYWFRWNVTCRWFEPICKGTQ